MLSFLTKDIASFGPTNKTEKIEKEKSESSHESNFTLTKSDYDPSHGFSINDVKSNKTNTSHV